MIEQPAAEPLISHPAATSGVNEADLRRAIRRAFPWIALTRALRMSFDLNKLSLSLLGMILLGGSLSLLDTLLLESRSVAPRELGGTGRFHNWPNSGFWFSDAVGRITSPVRDLSSPVLSFVTGNPFGWPGLHSFLSIIATVAIWGLVGGAVARIALVQLGWGQSLGLREALKDAVGHARPLIVTPLLPILVVVLAALFCSLFGLLFHIPVVGPILGGLVLIVPIILGVLMFVMIAALVAGWPLMVVSIAAEGEDELDALSRSFSYLNHRLGLLAISVAFAGLVAIPGLFLVDLTVDGILGMMRWGLLPTTPQAVLDSLSGVGVRGVDERWTQILPALWVGLVRLTARAWIYAYFWTVASLIYLQIRRDVDGARWSELNPARLVDGHDRAAADVNEPQAEGIVESSITTPEKSSTH
jgi:hypothetical protein